MISKKYLLIIFLLFHSFSFAQSRKKPLEIYIQKERYDNSLLPQNKFYKYQFLGNYYIDRQKKGVINYQYIDEGLRNLFPNKNDAGFLNVDLENQIYRNLKSSNKSLRIDAVKQFVSMVNYIKMKRPNIKVGLYGIPFSFNYSSQKNINNYSELEPIFKVVDYISPSLYFSFSDRQQSAKSLDNYINGNLTLFLDYAKRANKPVYLYVWYMVHPYNKLYGGEIVNESRMTLFLDRIKQFNFNGKYVDGIIWWEPADNSIQSLINNYHNKRGLKKNFNFNKTHNLLNLTRGI